MRKAAAPASETLNAAITAASEEYSFTGGEVTYDGSAHGFILSGIEDGETVLYSLDGETFDLTECPEYSNAGTYTVYVKVSRPNYEDWTGSADLVISPKQLTVTGATVVDKVYDGTNDAEVVYDSISGIVEGDDVEVTVIGTYESGDSGIWNVDVVYTLTGDDAGNYVAPESQTIRAVIANADIDPDSITITGGALYGEEIRQTVQVTAFHPVMKSPILMTIGIFMHNGK